LAELDQPLSSKRPEYDPFCVAAQGQALYDVQVVYVAVATRRVDPHAVHHHFASLDVKVPEFTNQITQAGSKRMCPLRQDEGYLGFPATSFSLARAPESTLRRP
jgi:hypothetical protein